MNPFIEYYKDMIALSDKELANGNTSISAFIKMRAVRMLNANSQIDDILGQMVDCSKMMNVCIQENDIESYSMYCDIHSHLMDKYRSLKKR